MLLRTQRRGAGEQTHPVPYRYRRRSVGLLLLAAALCAATVLLFRPAPVAVGAQPAPDFTLPAVAGGPAARSLRALRGHAVLLNFFNTQCDPCRQELPILAQAARTYRARGVVVLGIATGGDTMDSVRQFVAREHISYPVALDLHQSVAWAYDVSAWPASLFLDAQGYVRAQLMGPLDRGSVRAGLAQAGAISCSNCAHLPLPSLQTDAPAPGALAALRADSLYAPPVAAPAFALRDQRGALITPASLRGKVVALTFVSAVCTEQCPLVGATLSRIARSLGPNARRLAIVAISVDPEQDAPAATAHFAAMSGWKGLDWHYLTAPRAQLARIWSAYGIYVQPLPPIFKQSLSIVHGAQLLLIDPRGRMRAYYDVPFLSSRVAASIRALQ